MADQAQRCAEEIEREIDEYGIANQIGIGTHRIDVAAIIRSHFPSDGVGELVEAAEEMDGLLNNVDLPLSKQPENRYGAKTSSYCG